MTKLLSTAALLLALASPALAETYNYACQVSLVYPNPERIYLHSAKIDTTKGTITWRGTVYKNAKTALTVYGEDCAKWCFGNRKIMLSTATQGVATLAVPQAAGRPDDEVFECDLVRK